MSLRTIPAVFALLALSACSGILMTQSPESRRPPPAPVLEESGQLRIARDSAAEFIGLVHDRVTVDPVLIGDMRDLLSRINYPEEAQRAGVEGYVHLKFIVDTEGRVRNARVVQGIGGGCDQEALLTSAVYNCSELYNMPIFIGLRPISDGCPGRTEHYICGLPSRSWR